MENASGVAISSVVVGNTLAFWYVDVKRGKVEDDSESDMISVMKCTVRHNNGGHVSPHTHSLERHEHTNTDRYGAKHAKQISEVYFAKALTKNYNTSGMGYRSFYCLVLFFMLYER